MRRPLLCLALGFASAFVAVGSFGAWNSAEAETLKVRADIWCPYNCDPAGAQAGYMIDLMRATLEPAGFQIDYSLLNWARSLKEAMAGQIDAVVGANAEEVDGKLKFGAPDGMSQNVFLAGANAGFTIARPDDLVGQRVGVITDYSYSPALDAYLNDKARNGGLVERTAGDEPFDLNLRKLLAGRLTVVVEDANVARSRLLALGLADKVKIVGRETAVPIHIAFAQRPDADRLVKLLDDGIAALRRSGRLAEILKPYGVDDWAPLVPASTAAANPAS